MSVPHVSLCPERTRRFEFRDHRFDIEQRRSPSMSYEFERHNESFDRASLLRRGAAAGIALGLAGFVPRLAGARTDGATLNLVAYSTPKPVMSAIESNWARTPQGVGV